MDDADLTALRIPAALRDRAREILAVTDHECTRHLDDEYARADSSSAGWRASGRRL